MRHRFGTVCDLKSLTTLAADIDTTRMKSPSFMMVLTGIGDFPYQRDDGVYVVPVGCLRG